MTAESTHPPVMGHPALSFAAYCGLRYAITTAESFYKKTLEILPCNDSGPVGDNLRAARDWLDAVEAV